MPLNSDPESPSARMPALVLASLLAVGLVLAGVLAIQSRNSPSDLVVGTTPRSTAIPSTTSLGADPAPSSTSSTATPAVSIQTITRRPSPGSGASGAGAATAAPPVSGAPAQTPVTQPSTTRGECTPAQITQTLTTDKPDYNAGEIVNVIATVRNRSTSACTVADPDSNCYSLLVAYAAPDARPFWWSGGAGGSCSTFPRRTLVPGMSASINATWDQLDRRGCAPSDFACTRPRIAGSYTVLSAWLAESKATPVNLQ